MTFIGHSYANAQIATALIKNHGGVREMLNLYVALAPAIKLDSTRNGFFQALSNDYEKI